MGGDSLILYLTVYAVAVMIVIVAGFNRKIPSAGLSSAFSFNLLMNHYFGALVHALPWYAAYDYEFTYLGFEQTLYGMAAFAAGGVLIGPFIIRTFLRKSADPVLKPNPKLLTRYFQIGAVVYFLLGPLLGRVPSIGTFVTSAWNLLIVAFCLLCWKAWTDKKPFLVLAYLALSTLFPLFTSFSSGFLNSGTRAVMIILFFVATFFKPRRLVVIMLLLSTYLGLSLYETYFRDRTELREAIWYENQSTSQRIAKIWTTLSEFEFVDLRNQEHLTRIDARLNQNDFVGKSVVYLRDGMVPFARGSTVTDAILALIPRFIWADKPTYAGSSDLVSRYTGENLSQTTSFGVGYVMEFYVNFGATSVIIGFLFLGVLIRILDFKAAHSLVRGNWTGFTLWFLPACSFLETIDTLPAIMASAVSSLIFCWIMHRFLVRPYLGRLA